MLPVDGRVRIIRSKIGLRRKSPFFSYIVEFLNYQEKPEEECPSCAVNAKGDFIYNDKFIMSLPSDELTGVLMHEVLHLALLHPQRHRESDYSICSTNPVTGQIFSYTLWNVAVDMVVDAIVVEAGFPVNHGIHVEKIEEGYNGSLEVADDKGNPVTITIENIHIKSAEEIFEELKRWIKNNPSCSASSGGDLYQGMLDYHDFKELPKNEAGDSKGEKGKPKNVRNEEFWRKKLSEAEAYAKAQGQGNLPAGLQRSIGELKKPKINWRLIIQREIASLIPNDLTWRKPNKRYVVHDIYMPSLYPGEEVNVLFSIDTSGSISDADFGDIISELIGLSRQYTNVSFRLLTHDVEVHDDYEVKNCNLSKIKSLVIHGGGGTSHIPLFEYIDRMKYHKKYKLHINFTDGMSSFPDEVNINTLFILTKDNCGVANMPKWAKSMQIA